jgi:DNA invertase Pin-like site-specific DNA recombinase
MIYKLVEGCIVQEREREIYEEGRQAGKQAAASRGLKCTPS